MPPLSDRQADVLRFIETFRDTNGWPPSHRDLMEAFGWASKNAANDHLKRIAALGYIEIAPGVARGIRVLVSAPADAERSTGNLGGRPVGESSVDDEGGQSS